VVDICNFQDIIVLNIQ